MRIRIEVTHSDGDKPHRDFGDHYEITADNISNLHFGSTPKMSRANPPRALNSRVVLVFTAKPLPGETRHWGVRPLEE